MHGWVNLWGICLQITRMLTLYAGAPSKPTKITCPDDIVVSEISLLMPGLGVVTGDWLAARLGEYAGDLGLPASHMMFTDYTVQCHHFDQAKLCSL